MLVRKFECRSYQAGLDMLRGKTRRTVCNNTDIEAIHDAETSLGNRIWVILHGHIIVVHHADERTVVSSCGFRTRAAKDRINRCLPGVWQVYQHKKQWWLYPSGLIEDIDSYEEIPFVDGMVVPNVQEA